MQYQSIDWKKGVVLGAVAGVVWGWIAIAVNAITGAFPFEDSLLHNLATFAIGGAVFGIVTGGFLILLEGWFPLRGNLLKAVFISISLWIILFMGGYGLAVVRPERYVFELQQGVQGLILAGVFGVLLGLLWKVKGKEA